VLSAYCAFSYLLGEYDFNSILDSSVKPEHYN